MTSDLDALIGVAATAVALMLQLSVYAVLGFRAPVALTPRRQ